MTVVLPIAAMDWSGLYRAVFVDTWAFWAGGAAIGGVVLLLLATSNKLLGVSSGFQDACAAVTDSSKRGSWRFPLLGGIVAGGLLSAVLGGGLEPTWAMGMVDTVVSSSLPVKAALFTGGGLLIGFGTRLAGGCTSGHGIVGLAQLAPSSMVATGSFMAAGFVVTNLFLRALGA